MFGRGDVAGRERIAGTVGGEIHDAAALYSVGIAHGALGEDVVDAVSVVARLGVDEAADGSVLGGNFRFHSAPGVVVLGDDDRAFHRNAQAVELFVVFGQPVVHEHERSSHIAVRGIGVVGGKLLGFLIRRGIDCERGLFEFRRELRRLDHFQHANFRSRKEDVESFNVRVESPFFEAGQDPLGIVLVVRRADVVRARTQVLHVGPQVCGVGDGTEFILPVPLGLAGAGRVAIKSGFVGSETRTGQAQIENQQHSGEPSHACPFVD